MNTKPTKDTTQKSSTQTSRNTPGEIAAGFVDEGLKVATGFADEGLKTAVGFADEALKVFFGSPPKKS